MKEKYGPEFYRVSSMDCCICSAPCWWAHHVKTVGGGGKDKDNCIPVCVDHHAEIEIRGRKTVQTRYDIDFVKIAKEIGNESPID